MLLRANERRRSAYRRCCPGSISASTSGEQWSRTRSAAFISGENPAAGRWENDSKKFAQRIMNPQRRRAGGCKPFIHSYPNRALYGNSIGNISILDGMAAHGTTASLHPARRPLSYHSYGHSADYTRRVCAPAFAAQ